MKVKTFTVIVAMLFLLAMLAIAHYAPDIKTNMLSAQDIMPNSSSIATPAATEVPHDNDDNGSTIA